MVVVKVIVGIKNIYRAVFREEISDGVKLLVLLYGHTNQLSDIETNNDDIATKYLTVSRVVYHHIRVHVLVVIHLSLEFLKVVQQLCTVRRT